MISNTGKLKPNGQRARNAIALIWIVLALNIVALLSGYFQYELLKSIGRGEVTSMATANANDIREQVIGLSYVVAYIISAIMFIQWFRRAYYNLHQRVEQLSFSEGWAAGAWFVPILNLFRPYQIMTELYRETKKLLTQSGLNLSEKLSTSKVTFWWGLWIFGNILGQVVFRMARNAESLDALITMTMVSMVSNIMGVLLALVTWQVVKSYSEVEPLLQDLPAPTAADPPQVE